MSFAEFLNRIPSSYFKHEDSNVCPFDHSTNNNKPDFIDITGKSSSTDYNYVCDSFSCNQDE